MGGTAVMVSGASMSSATPITAVDGIGMAGRCCAVCVLGRVGESYSRNSDARRRFAGFNPLHPRNGVDLALDRHGRSIDARRER